MVKATYHSTIITVCVCVCVCVCVSVCLSVCTCYVASVMSDSLQPIGLQPARLLCLWDSPGKNTGVSCHALLQVYKYVFTSVQSLSHVRLFATHWTAALQASLSITNSQSLLKLTSMESVMPSNHLIMCCPLLLPPSIFPSIRVLSNESGGQSIGATASASVLPMNTQD